MITEQSQFTDTHMGAGTKAETKKKNKNKEDEYTAEIVNINIKR